MKLDRTINGDGRGKYAILKLRRQSKPISDDLMECANKLRAAGLLEFNDNPETDFFVIKLKDKYAAPALGAYAAAALSDDPEYAAEIFNLARTAATHPSQKRPT